ncbi:hypothetical protein DQ237_17430 [Blastococcus sp. TF02-8]|uniref:hypothetical protein n=1 Tax=Blastococcus sp. TF02-8 TaxID=2250574 RepID=UPI000DE994A5|nr:hypothetical protein [Blastococcus sp. TF02-8]RBY93566.1 hypothetical protein DQ237_17430 [Blastococcus sp. TF02-8]
MQQTVYLSSLESTRFEPVRECRLLETLAFETGKVAVRASLDPPVPGQDFGRGDDIDTVVITTRHEGASLAPIDEFPCFVFIAIPRVAGLEPSSPLRSDDLEIVGWGELYRSHEDAAGHVFR